MPNDYARELLGTLTIDRQPGLWRFISQNDPPDLHDAIFAFREPKGWTALVPYRDVPERILKHVRFNLDVETHVHPVGLGEVIPEILREAEISCFFIDGGWGSAVFVEESEADRAEALLASLVHKG
jgi:hypothetical protein